MGKNQNDCSIRVPCLRLLDESDWDNAEPESPDLDLWIFFGCSRGHTKASRQRDDYGEKTIMKSIILVIAFAIGIPIVAIASQVPQHGFNFFAAIFAFSVGAPLSFGLGLCIRTVLKML